MPRLILLAGAILALVATGIVATGGTVPALTTNSQPTDTPAVGTDTPPPGLESTLDDLATADDPAAYATTHDIPYDDGRVEVAVRLHDGATMPTGYRFNTTHRHDDRIQGSVPVTELRALAAEANVSTVRLPNRVEPARAHQGPVRDA